MKALAAVVFMLLCTPYGWVGLILAACFAEVLLRGRCG